MYLQLHQLGSGPKRPAESECHSVAERTPDGTVSVAYDSMQKVKVDAQSIDDHLQYA